jgi:uncharacterized integral membrane protein
VTAPDPRPAGAPGDPLGAGPPYTTPSAPPAGAPGAVPAPPPSPPPTTQPARSTGRTIGRTLALALLIFVTVILVLFVVFNTQTVDISLVFTDVQAPLVVALLVAAVLGGLVVELAGLLRRARRGR